MRASGTFTRAGTFARPPICSGRTTSASGYVPGGTNPLADVFPRNKSAAEQFRYDRGNLDPHTVPRSVDGRRTLTPNWDSPRG